MPEVLEERSVIWIVLAMIVRSRAGHREVHELQALPIGGPLDFSFRAIDRANDGFDVRVKRAGWTRGGVKRTGRDW